MIESLKHGFNHYVTIPTQRTAPHLRTCGRIQHGSGWLRNADGTPTAAASSCVTEFLRRFCRTENACDTVRCVVLRIEVCTGRAVRGPGRAGSKINGPDRTGPDRAGTKRLGSCGQRLLLPIYPPQYKSNGTLTALYGNNTNIGAS